MNQLVYKAFSRRQCTSCQYPLDRGARGELCHQCRDFDAVYRRIRDNVETLRRWSR